MTLIKEWIDKKIEDEDIKYFEYDKFSSIVEIGKGAFGKVSKACLACMGLEVALKSFVDENSNIEEKTLNGFVNELKLLRKVYYHDNINRFLGITKNSFGNYVMVLAYANEGNLREYLKKKFTSLEWEDKLQMALDITCGLKCLHSEDIIHRDLHSKNILVNDGKLLIADLGLSKRLAEISSNSTANELGMIEYMEPQCYKTATKFRKDKKSDIYSLGVLLWEITSGRPPFSNYHRDEIYALGMKICFHNLRETPIEDTPLEYQQLYQKCWDDDPKLRPDIEEVHRILNQLKTGVSSDRQPDVSSDGRHSNAKDSSQNGLILTGSNSRTIKNLFVIGCTGCGKSALCNVLTGIDESKESEPSFQKKEFAWDGSKYCVVDVIGLRHTKLSTKKVLEKIEEGIRSMPEGISQILYVIDGRFTAEEIRMFELLKNDIFESGILKYVTIVRTKFSNFNNKEACENDKNQLNQLHKESEIVASIVKSCNDIIYIDNPSTNILLVDNDDRDTVEHNKKIKARSKTILLNHLEKVCQEKYFKLDKLYPKVFKYIKENGTNEVEADSIWKYFVRFLKIDM
ncbi:kinase-like domain-containing protein [Glomus cerebriforme]|uniref:Kinase-like domain-containing protein n=1 Tax=Glomus cerebriforme TaxID=658196 RepID=A0A397SSK6_9GLOM|nr:kinase-like domain-containing protein [Glomus cerebriforme]